MSTSKIETLELVHALLEALPERNLYATLVHLLPTLLHAYAGPSEASVTLAAKELLLDGVAKSEEIQAALGNVTLLQSVPQAFEAGRERHHVQLKLLDLLICAYKVVKHDAIKDAIRIMSRRDESGDDVLYLVGLIQSISTLSQLETETGHGLCTLRAILRQHYDEQSQWFLACLVDQGLVSHDSIEDELLCVEVLRLIAKLPGSDCVALSSNYRLLDLLRDRLASANETIRDKTLQCLATLFSTIPDGVWDILPARIGNPYIASLGMLLERSPTNAWKTRILEEKCPGDYLLQLLAGLSSTFEAPRKVSYYHCHQLATWQQGVALLCGSEGVLALLTNGKGEYHDIVTKHEIMSKALETLRADDGCGRDLSGGHRRKIEAFVNAGPFARVADGSMQVASQTT
ncbi:hypothetical protein BCR37DRAFT_393196 [Protomyces lactucae-debilis]|uniref:26S proteasome non-ATPase regulatory subunit 5 n=1 Tax=Protomyces lactucae-debilis TaxID=2754530 RepID=A0A1Y2FDC7_PROLT|nr:uncharacterized protein BCR37DRAFT_393196 [Protomyces lactucae-debilis]ORY81316.1 hypothetical protein BCR37DRAFT_393196 [Protomyces lactucae-debilis]